MRTRGAVWEWTDRVAKPRAEAPASATLPLTIDLREIAARD